MTKRGRCGRYMLPRWPSRLPASGRMFTLHCIFWGCTAGYGLPGESAFAIRLLSLFFGLIGSAATYAVGKRLFDRATGLIALAVLGASGFFIYYTREARMYTLLLALAALSTWVYLLWRDRPSRRRTPDLCGADDGDAVHPLCRGAGAS